MEMAIQAVHATYCEAHPVISKPLTVSAQYSKNESARRIIHENLRKIRDSLTANDKLI